MAERVHHTLSPWVAADSRVLILGTMPSPMSRARGMYYGHRQNRFWKTLAALWNEAVPVSPQAAQNFTLRHRLALWDVLAECTIEGAADASIASPQANDVAGFLAQHPSITHVATTGKKAHALYNALLLSHTGIAALSLPSTSAANRSWWPDDKLLEAYRILYTLIEGDRHE